MNADRVEKMSVTRSLTHTSVRCTITEDGVTVHYTVKTYETQVKSAAQTARAGAERLLAQVLDRRLQEVVADHG